MLKVNSQNSYIEIRDSINKYTTSNTSKAILFSSNYIDKAQEENNPQEQFKGYYILQQLYAKNNQHKKSIATCDTMLNFANSKNLENQLFKAYFYKCVAIYKSSNSMNIDIIENLTQALKIARKKKNIYWQCKFLSEIAEFYNYSKDFNKAKVNLKEALNLYKTINNLDDYKNYGFEGVSLIKLYHDLTQLYINEKYIDSALYFSNKLRPLLNTKDYTNKINTFTYYTDRADINLLEKKPNLSEKHIDSAYNTIKGLELPYNGLRLFVEPYYRGKIAFLKDNHQEVIRVLKAIPKTHLTQRKNENRNFYDYYKLLAKSYMYLGDYEKAESYFEKHLKSIDNQIKYGDSIQLKFKEIETTEFNTEIKKAKSQRQQQKFWITTLLVLFISIVLSLLLIIIRQKTKNRQKFNQVLSKLKILEEQKNNKTLTSKKSQNINEIKVDRILNALTKFEEKEFFLSINCTLASTAKKVKTNTTYLSKIINSEYQKSFNAYITDLRINYAIKRLKEDQTFRKYSILAIANEVGYKSKEGFNKAFKNTTGILPSYFIKQLEETD